MQPPDLSLLLVMAVFWATFFVLKAFLFKPLGAILRDREERERSADYALEKALEGERAALAEIEARLMEVRREALAEREAARAVAAARRQAVLDDARKDAEQKIGEAGKRLAADVASAREELRANVRKTAVEIASLALGRSVA